MTEEQASAVHAMAYRIAGKTGFDPAIIIAILTALMPLISNCLKPKPPKTPQEALVELAQDHLDSCPWYLRGTVRSHLPAGRRRLSDVNDLWAAIADEAVANPEQACMALAA